MSLINLLHCGTQHPNTTTAHICRTPPCPRTTIFFHHNLPSPFCHIFFSSQRHKMRKHIALKSLWVHFPAIFMQLSLIIFLPQCTLICVDLASSSVYKLPWFFHVTWFFWRGTFQQRLWCSWQSLGKMTCTHITL